MRAALFAFVLLFGFLFVSYAIYQRQNQNDRKRIILCEANNRMLGVLSGLVDRSDRSLEIPGAPGYSYYKSHPRELREAHRANAMILSDLRPIRCRS